jgi:hypothetical protein
MEQLQQSNGSAAYTGHRSVMEGPWHFCARCGSRVHISEMQWQFGLLLCKTWDCIDYGNDGLYLIGTREAAIAHALENISNERELMPDPKLTEPSEAGTDSETGIIY